MWLWVKLIPLLASFLTSLSLPIPVDMAQTLPAPRLIQPAIVDTDFNYNQHYGGIHCGMRKKPLLGRAKRVTAGPEQAIASDDLVNYGPGRENSDRYGMQMRAFNGRKENNNTAFNFVALVRVKVLPNQYHFCSGVLITDRHILTAAHCVLKCHDNKPLGAPASGITVSLGEAFERWDVDLRIGIKSVRVHDQFDPCNPNYEFDIAMLATLEIIPVTESTNRVCLPPYQLNPYGSATALGFGFTSKTDKLLWRRLNSVSVLMNNDNNCIDNQPPYKADMICVAGFNLNFCAGDSGGPLVINIQGAMTLVGINSITDFSPTDSVECAGANYKSKFVRINKLIRWIGETLEKI